MKQYVIILSILITGIFYESCAQVTASSEILFEERAEDWFSEGDAEWKFINGELSGSLENGSGFVMTKKSYDDFILELEFKPDSTINSGVFIRCKEKAISYADCYEINIWDLHPNQKNRTGSVVSRSNPLAQVETLDKWNNYKIKTQKDHLQVWIDNILVVDLKNKELQSGPIALQAAEKGQIMFRNVKLTSIK